MKLKMRALGALLFLVPPMSVAAATFDGTWGSGGHFVGSPITYQFVDEPTPPGANPHPAKNWTPAETTVVVEAFREWDTLLCDICFSQGTSPNITLRWEDSDFFGGALPGSANYIAWSYFPGSEFNLPTDYPKNEIYFNTAVTWYVDPNPATDEAFTGWDLLTVAKHEIGHMLGLTHQIQDYFDANPNYVPGVMDDRTVATGGWGANDRRHPTNADWSALSALGYAVHVPEPETYAMVLAGLGILLVVRRKQQKISA